MATPASPASAGTMATTEATSSVAGTDKTSNPLQLPIGPGQLDKALPATRLLEKRRLMYLVHEELERQKIECAQKEEILQKREEALREKDVHLQESLVGFSKFLQENAVKKKRAEKKCADEIRMRLEKEAEILVLENNLETMKEARMTTSLHLERFMVYQKYLESVVETATAYHEINDLLMRHATLAASHNDLNEQVETCADQMELVRAELQNYSKTTVNDILTLNNDVSVTKQVYEKKKVETAEFQLHIDSILHMAAAKTLARSQMCMAADNLFSRIDRVSVISRPPWDNALKQLDVVGDYITDLNYIQKAYKGTPTKRDTPISKE